MDIKQHFYADCDVRLKKGAVWYYGDSEVRCPGWFTIDIFDAEGWKIGGIEDTVFRPPEEGEKRKFTQITSQLVEPFLVTVAMDGGLHIHHGKESFAARDHGLCKVGTWDLPVVGYRPWRMSTCDFAC